MDQDVDIRMAVLAGRAACYPGLSLLVLFGSRARADEHLRSDWDLGFMADGAFDPQAFLVEATLILESDAIDLVNLERAGGLLRFQAAREGYPIFERSGGEFETFCLAAARFWFDAGPIIEREYADLLEGLRR